MDLRHLPIGGEQEFLFSFVGAAGEKELLPLVHSEAPSERPIAGFLRKRLIELDVPRRLHPCRVCPQRGNPFPVSVGLHQTQGDGSEH